MRRRSAGAGSATIARCALFAEKRRGEGRTWAAIATELGAVRDCAALVHGTQAADGARAAAGESNRGGRGAVARARARLTERASRGGRDPRRRRRARTRARMILGTSRAVRVYAYPAAVDLRKGYDGLYGLVRRLREGRALRSPNVDAEVHDRLLSFSFTKPVGGIGSSRPVASPRDRYWRTRLATCDPPGVPHPAGARRGPRCAADAVGSLRRFRVGCGSFALTT